VNPLVHAGTGAGGMNLDQRFRLVLILNVVVSMFGFGIANSMMFLVPPVLAIALTGWWVTEYRAQRKGWRGLPRWLSNSILLVMLVVAVLRAFATTDLVMSFTEFLIAILIIKLWERRKIRDYGQLLTLSMFMSVGSTLGSSSLLMGLVWAVHLPLLIAGVMMFQVFAGRARAVGVWTPAAAGVPSTGLVVRRGAFFRLWATVLLVGLVVSGGIFVVVPRGMGTDEFGISIRSPMQQVGFTEEVDPGEGSLISSSYATVMEVRFTKAGVPLGGFGEPFYLRGAVLDQYGIGGSTTWQARRAGAFEYEANHGRWVTLARRSGEVIEQQVTVLSGGGRETPMFALYRPQEVKLDPSLQQQTLRYERPTGRISRAGDGGRVNYWVRSVVPPRDESVVVRHDAAPYPSEKVKAYAWDVLRRADIEPDSAKRALVDDERAARVFENHLRQNFEYATDQLKSPVGVDPTEWFLHDGRRGHCEYFASALAAMCRSVGINARVVAGYLAAEFDEARGVYVVRESDAHAWAEVDTGPGGWVTMDATPEATGQVVREAGVIDTLSKMYASLSDFWNINVATFGAQDQERLLGQFGFSRLMEKSSEWYRRSAKAVHRVWWWVGTPGAAAWVIGGAIAVGGLVWATAREWKRRGRRAEAFGWAMDGPERRVYRELLRVLAGHGYEKPAWSPPLAHLRAIEARNPRLARRAAAIFEHVYAARFGHEAGRLSAAQAELTALREGR